MENELSQAIEMCRAAADKLASASNREQAVVFPGWDFTGVPPGEISSCEAVRHTAEAIVGTENPDDGAAVTRGDLAELIRYIADMLEE
jgi:hypothetical protein